MTPCGTMWHTHAARARTHTHVFCLRVADTDRPGVIARQCLLQPSPGRQQLRLACAARPVPPAPHAAWVAYRWLAVAHGVYQQQIHLLYTQLPQVLRAHNSHTHTGTCRRARTHPERERGGGETCWMYSSANAAEPTHGIFVVTKICPRIVAEAFPSAYPTTC